MSLTAKQGGAGVPPIDAGLHPAICYAVIDLGTHFNEAFGKRARKVLIQWEVTDSRITVERDGKQKDMPRAISKTYTFSLHKRSALRACLESWRGKLFDDDEVEHGFDLTKLLGLPCTLNLMHVKGSDGRTFANISGVLTPAKGPPPKAENPLVSFDIDNLAAGIPEGLPDWVKDKIKQSDEYKALVSSGDAGRSSEQLDADEAPF